MELFASQDPRSYSLYFDLNIWFRARKVTGTFEKRAPDQVKHKNNHSKHEKKEMAQQRQKEAPIDKLEED